MGHCVQLVIGRGAAVEAFLALWPARAVSLSDDWRAIPIDGSLYDAIAASARGPQRDPALDMSPPGLEAALARASIMGALAYVETDYHGGQGDQSAGAWVDGRVRAMQRGHGAINSALAAIGVERDGDKDAFDTIRLGKRRSLEDYEPEGPVRLRSDASSAERPASTAHLNLSVALVFIIAMISVGVAIALL